MNDRIKVRFVRESDVADIEAFARRRVKWLAERSITAEWAGAIRHQAAKISGDNWRVFVVTVDEVSAGRVCAWIEPPTDPANGDRSPRIGVLGLTGLCTDPDVPGAAAHLAAWSARYAGSLGLSTVRLPTVQPRLRDHYQTLGFELGNESVTPKGKTMWELFRAAE